MNYVKWAATALLTEGNDVTLATTPEAREHPLFQEALTYCKGKLNVVYERGPVRRWPTGQVGALFRQLEYWHWLGKAQRRTGASFCHSFVPYLDSYNKALSFLGSPFRDNPWSGIMLRPSFHLRSFHIQAPATPSAAMEERLLLRLLSKPHLHVAFTIDPFLARFAKASSITAYSKIAYAPDPQELENTMTRSEARSRLNFNDETFVILAYGGLSRRKGLARLLSSLHHDDFPKDSCVVLAGVTDTHVCELLNSVGIRLAVERGLVRYYGGVIDKNMEECLMRAADLVWLVYDSHYGSSGVLGLAAAAHVPVLGCQHGLIGAYIRNDCLGWTVTDEESIATAISRATTGAVSFADNLASFAHDHSVDSFQGIIRRTLAPTGVH